MNCIRTLSRCFRARSCVIRVHYQFYNTKRAEDFTSRTYTSQFYRVSQVDILAYLEQNEIEWRQQNNYAQLRQCPFCTKKNFDDRSNQFTFGINLINGSFSCLRASCAAKGSWFDFKNFVGGKITREQLFQKEEPSEKLLPHEFHIHRERFKRREPVEAYEYLTGHNWELVITKVVQNQRGISEEVCNKYQIGLDFQKTYNNNEWTEIPVIQFPMFRLRDASERKQLEQQNLKKKANQLYNNSTTKDDINPNYELVSSKVRGARQDLKYYQKIEPQNACKGIFGLHLLNLDVEQIIITEGEFDAMAAYQMTGIPSISLPFGINHMPDYLVEWLDQYKKLTDIIIWVDDDTAGRNNAPKISQKLGLMRTRIVTPSHIDMNVKDANDCLRYQSDRINELLKSASSSMSKNIIQMIDIRNQVKDRYLNAEKKRGVSSKTFHSFNKTIKGLRSGELTVITGPTGSGKTTFLSQLSLEFCQKGIQTLWGSFEIKNDVLLTSALKQAFKIDLSKKEELIDSAIEKFQDYPFYMLTFYGSTQIQNIIDTIEYGIYKYHISHVCLDNLQFMLGTQASGFKKFDFQDEVIEKFRHLASKYDIHLSLVIHPKKVDENEDLQTSSVFGSAKATQEADNVFIIQNRPGYRVFDIKKNRYDGEIGRFALGFDSNLKSYFELNSEEVKALNEQKSTILQIIEKRITDGRHFAQELLVSDKKPNDGGNDDGGGPTSENHIIMHNYQIDVEMNEEVDEAEIDEANLIHQNTNDLEQFEDPLDITTEKQDLIHKDQNAEIVRSMVIEADKSNLKNNEQQPTQLELTNKIKQPIAMAGLIDPCIQPSLEFQEAWDYDSKFNFELQQPDIFTQNDLPNPFKELDELVRVKPVYESRQETKLDYMDDQIPLDQRFDAKGNAQFKVKRRK